MSLTCSCCSPFEDVANQQFNRKRVAEELARYRKNGPGPTTRLLVEGLETAGALQGTVVDVGAGFGSLTYALLERGASSAVAVEASAAYLAAAHEEATRLGHTKAVRFALGDFVAEAAHIPTANVVMLDRVVCCYPSCESLLDAALGRAERCLGLSYPRDAWWVRAAVRLENGRRWLQRNPFRMVVHPTRIMRERIARSGFTLSTRRTTGMWSVDIWVRSYRNAS